MGGIADSSGNLGEDPVGAVSVGPEQLPPQDKDEVDVGLDNVLGESGLHVQTVSELDAMKGRILNSLGVIFTEIGSIEIKDGFDFDSLRIGVHDALMARSEDIFNMNADFGTLEEAETFVSSAAFAVASEVNKHQVFEGLDSMEDRKKLEGVIGLAISVDSEKGSLKVKVELDDKIKDTLEALKRGAAEPAAVEATPDGEPEAEGEADQEPEAEEGKDESPEELAAGAKKGLDQVKDAVEAKKTDVAGLVQVVADNPVIMANIMKGFNEALHYEKVETKLSEQVGLHVNYANIGILSAVISVVGVNSPENRIKFNERYKTVIHEGVQKALQTKFDQALVTALTPYFTGETKVDEKLDLDLLKYFQDTDQKFKFKLDAAGHLVVEIPPYTDFEKAYKAAKGRKEEQSMPKQEKKNYEEAQKGIIGWIMKTFLGIDTPEEWKSIISGDHAFSYFYGIISVATGGKSYKWAHQKGLQAYETMGNSEMLKKWMPAADSIGQRLASLAPGANENPIMKAKWKSNIEVAQAINNKGEGGFSSFEKDKKGIRFKNKYILHEEDTFTFRLEPGAEVVFARTMTIYDGNGDLIGDQGSLEVGADAGTTDYMIKGESIPKGTYFSSGVKFKEERVDYSDKDRGEKKRDATR